MNIKDDDLEVRGLPGFLEETAQLIRYMKSLSYEEAKAVWKCNDQIAGLNYQRFSDMELPSVFERRLTPAVLSYEGIQYQYMSPGIFGNRELNYIQEHLYILSGLYGALKPFDGIIPYRLEMQAKIRMEQSGQWVDSLYEFWGDKIYREVTKDSKVILNLASKEYSKAVEMYLEPDVQLIQCIFGSLETDKAGKQKVKVKATEAKMARGEMVRFLAEKNAEGPEEAKGFDRLGYEYREEWSDNKKYVFIKKGDLTDAGGRSKGAGFYTEG